VIGASGFDQCVGIKSVSFASGNVAIGTSGFSSCVGVTAVTFPDGDVQITNNAFYGCTALGSTAFSATGSVQIGDFAFQWCLSLGGVFSLRVGLKSVGVNPFAGCAGLTGFYIDAKNQHYQVDDTALYNKDDTWLVARAAGAGPSSIPVSVTSIRPCAMYGNGKMTDTVVLASVSSIGEYVFHYCGGITVVALAAERVTVGCYGLYGIGYPGTVSFCTSKENVTLGSKAFRDGVSVRYDQEYVGDSTAPFTPSGQFAASDSFTGSRTFTRSDAFSESESFSESEPFSASDSFTASDAFSESEP